MNQPSGERWAVAARALKYALRGTIKMPSDQGKHLSASQSATGRKVSIQYYVRRWLSLTTSTNADGSSEIFVNLTKQY